MKRLILTTLTSLSLLCVFSGVAFSRPLACPFTDTFYITGGSIKTLNVAGNLKISQISSTKFTDGCADGKLANDGTISLAVIGSSAQNNCQLTIVDGPFEWNPSVTDSHCEGNLQYSGIDHTTGTYSYTLKFSSSSIK